MSTKDIRPANAYVPCDVCGRTLLRGERSEVFITGGNRHTVCELCKPRALQEGWIREGTVPDYDPAAQTQDRRRGVFGRRRRARDQGSPGPATSLDDALSGGSWPTAEPTPSPSTNGRSQKGESAAERSQRRRERPRTPRPVPRESPAADLAAGAAGEPRHVHAVPAGEDSRIAAAAQAFNRSEHPRTVAGVARSLGVPTVAVIPDPAHPTLIRIVASWELCWYRYEVDLGDSRASVRLDTQGYELNELAERERVGVAAADDAGLLHLD
jgi:hypothetical protein